MFEANFNKRTLIANKELCIFERLRFEFAVNLTAKLQHNTKKRFPNLFVGTQQKASKTKSIHLGIKKTW